MSIENKVMLITYADSMGANLKELAEVLDNHFGKAVGGVHILPFFPSSADRGFAPLTYESVDPAFGNWADISAVARGRYLMMDFMINHISRHSEYYLDFKENKEGSPYRDLFIRYKDFWQGGGPTQEQVDAIYKRKPRAPYIDIDFADGSTEKLWCTFGEEQVDLDVRTEFTRQFIRDGLVGMARHGADIIRLDAFAYAVKKAGGSCFFEEPEIWELLERCAKTAAWQDAEILPEIHEHYSIQMKLADHGYWVYDFALPMLVLHALYTGRGESLRGWLRICPRKQFTTLDTHDGIGVVDVKDLMSEADIAETRELLYKKGANVKEKYSGTDYNNLDIYQINCTYYSALGDDDSAYLAARAIQFFAPGIPQVYYVGMLAGRNDIELLERTKEGRNINRHAYSVGEIGAEVKRPVVKKLIRLMEFRNAHPAFHGEINIPEPNDEKELVIERTCKGEHAFLRVDLGTHAFTIEYSEKGAAKQLKL